MPRPLRAGLALLVPPVLLVLAFLVADAIFPFPGHMLAPPPATVVTARDGTPLRFFLPPDGRWRFPIRSGEAGPVLTRALIAAEDRFFSVHPGVNPLAVLRAALSNLRSRRVVSGASTIQMQIARLAEPRPRTLLSKSVEAFRALQLQLHHSREELLTIYMNMTPFGGNIVGVGAAAHFYFGKKPAELTLGEAAFIALLPRSPARYDPVRHPEQARAGRDRVLDTLLAFDAFPADQVAEAKRQPLPDKLSATPFVAPHFSRMAATLANNPDRVRTTLDASMQPVVASIVRDRVVWLRSHGIESAAAVVLDLDSGDVLAMVGSPDFFDSRRAGQVNLTTSPRSPGSALKPFLYGLALDTGLVVPQSVLLDIPTSFAGYAPENYDGRYRGRVTVRQALVQSLNAPAVRLLARAGLSSFHGLLRRGGLSTLEPSPARYGLPLALGACEVTLMELTGMYAALGRGGTVLPPRLVLPPEGVGDRDYGSRIFSPEAVDQLTAMLTEVERPDLPRAWRLTRGVPAVAWKTGTSFGHRDAWALGYSGRLAVGVWVGNPDGASIKGISGATHAGPLLFDLFRALEPEGSSPRAFGAEPVHIELCAVSHDLPGPFCPDRIAGQALPGSTSLMRCDMHRRIFVDTRSGLRLEGDCLSGRRVRSEIVLRLPAELAAWKSSLGQPVPDPVPLSPDCTDVLTGPGPKIVSPQPGTPYIIRSEAPTRFQRIALSAQAPPDAGKLFWYQDGLLAGSARPDEVVFVEPVPGRHRLVVLDDKGRMDAMTFIVR